MSRQMIQQRLCSYSYKINYNHPVIKGMLSKEAEQYEKTFQSNPSRWHANVNCYLGLYNFENSKSYAGSEDTRNEQAPQMLMNAYYHLKIAKATASEKNLQAHVTYLLGRVMASGELNTLNPDERPLVDGALIAEAFKIATDLQPRCHDYWIARACFAHTAHDISAEEKGNTSRYLVEAFRLDPQSWIMMYNLGVLWTEKGLYGPAMRVTGRLLHKLRELRQGDPKSDPLIEVVEKRLQILNNINIPGTQTRAENLTKLGMMVPEMPLQATLASEIMDDGEVTSFFTAMGWPKPPHFQDPATLPVDQNAGQGPVHQTNAPNINQAQHLLPSPDQYQMPQQHNGFVGGNMQQGGGLAMNPYPQYPVPDAGAGNFITPAHGVGQMPLYMDPNQSAGPSHSNVSAGLQQPNYPSMASPQAPGMFTPGNNFAGEGWTGNEFMNMNNGYQVPATAPHQFQPPSGSGADMYNAYASTPMGNYPPQIQTPNELQMNFTNQGHAIDPSMNQQYGQVNDDNMGGAQNGFHAQAASNGNLLPPPQDHGQSISHSQTQVHDQAIATTDQSPGMDHGHMQQDDVVDMTMGNMGMGGDEVNHSAVPRQTHTVAGPEEPQWESRFFDAEFASLEPLGTSNDFTSATFDGGGTLGFESEEFPDIQGLW